VILFVGLKLPPYIHPCLPNVIESQPQIIMSKHRVKSVALDNDYDDDYDYDQEEDIGMGEEDKEQMRLGTIKVRETLGAEFHATDEEIQEALWHYYYDVGKSVTYIKSISSNSMGLDWTLLMVG
jgi:hypothetical protein